MLAYATTPLSTTLPITDYRVRGEKKKMKKDKTYGNKYWELEEGETVEIGPRSAVRCFDKAGKLQFGTVLKDRETGEEKFIVKFVLDRNELFSSFQGVDYLRGLLDEWEEMWEADQDDD